MAKTIDILIPAYNEEKNIANVIEQVSKQTIYSKISNIYVISDNSTDKTEEIVKALIKKFPKVKLGIKKKRGGKVDSLNKGFKISKADVLIMLDADIHLDQDYSLEELVRPFFVKMEKKVGLTVLKNSPHLRKKNWASIASLFSIYIRYEIIKLQSPDKFNSFYSLCGRATAISKEVYSKARITNDPGDDQELFFQTLKAGHYAYYVDTASVSYNVPLTIKDHIRQNIRFKKGVNFKRQNYGDLIDMYTKLGWKKYLAFFLTAIKHPICALAWIPVYTAGAIATTRDKKFNTGAWEMCESTK